MEVRELGGFLCGRRLYETMLVVTDPSMRENELDAAFADAWCAIPKIVFSRTLDSVQGNVQARRGVGGRGGRCGARRDFDKDVGIGGAGLAAAAIELGLVDELRMFRNPVSVGGTLALPPVAEDVPLDLVETRTFGSRVIYERYGRARDESD